jgi:hypothetical protein
VLNPGNISVTSQIAAAAAGYGTLSLFTAGQILDATGTEQTDLTLGSLALRANAGIGSADDLDTAVTTLASATRAARARSISRMPARSRSAP